MNKPLRRFGWSLALVLSISLCGALHAASGPATIIDVSSTGCDPQHPGGERATLAGYLTTAGYTVNSVTTGVVPSDLTGQKQVWDIRCQAVLSPTEIATYTAYLSGGGSLFLMGENTGYAASRDASLISYIATLGGGSLTLTSTNNSQTAQPPFNGPTSLTTVSFRAIGGTTTAGAGAFATKDANNFGGSLAFGPGSLSSAPTGTLIIVFDVNFLDNDVNHSASETAFGQNLVAYLAAPTPIQTAPVVTSVSPNSGSAAGGNTVTITGSKFTGATSVTFGGVAAPSFTVVSDTSITATVPAGTVGAASVIVTTTAGSNTANTLYTYAAAPPTPIPTLGEWGMIILGTALALCGLLLLRRQKHTTAAV